MNMTKFPAAVGGLALAALLGLGAVPTFGAGERAPTASPGAPLRVADLPIGRVFQATVPFSGMNPPPFTLNFPPNAGVLIRKVSPNMSSSGLYRTPSRSTD